MRGRIVTKTPQETQRAARDVLKLLLRRGRNENILLLDGELGAGKTTFVQGLARSLGIRAPAQSPTFVLMRLYAIPKRARFAQLVHIDAYRLKNSRAARALRIREFAADPKNLLVIEWAERIRAALPLRQAQGKPRRAIRVQFKHGTRKRERIISFQIPDFQFSIFRYEAPCSH